MCDYSLMAFPNRLAVTGEALVVHRFQTYSLGLISPPVDAAPNDGRSHRSVLWSAIVGYFKDRSTKPVVAVCIPPGSKLLLRDIPATLRDNLQVGPMEEVTFTQLSANAYTYRDAVRFSNGRELALQHLFVGQRVKVLSIASEANPSTPEMADFHEHAIRR